ncbi:MAG: Maf family protein [Pseudomonadota bacterium]
MSALSRLPLLLASASPRRRELLTQIGVRFELATHDVDETPRRAEPPEDYVLRMALEKAMWVADRAATDQAVLGADTTVVLDGQALGKPRHREHALEMLAALSGRSHQVWSAVAVSKAGETRTALSMTEVEFRDLSRQEALAYWHTGEPGDKAGAYAIQGVGALFVTRMTGSYSGVVGLPLQETAQLLIAFGVPTALTIGVSNDE